MTIAVCSENILGLIEKKILERAVKVQQFGSVSSLLALYGNALKKAVL